MFSSLLIGLREGLEAALVVGILVAFLVRTDRRDRLGALWLGVGLAVALSLAVGAVLEFTAANLSDRALETFVGITSLATVAFVTTMVFWMQRTARNMRGDLEGHLSTALAAGATAICITAFVAVVREGIETALFLWSNVRTNGDSFSALLGGVAGLALAVNGSYFAEDGPIGLVQHLPIGFASSFALFLQGCTALRVVVVEKREPAEGGTLFIAPDDKPGCQQRAGRAERAKRAIGDAEKFVISRTRLSGRSSTPARSASGQ